MNRKTPIVVIKKTIYTVPAERVEPLTFRNYYHCPNDQTKWRDEWSCACNDRCPSCDTEIEPYFSEEIGI